MGDFRKAHFIAVALLAVATWAVSATRRSHWAFAAYATWMWSMDWVRIGLATKRHGLTHPFTGVARATFHADQAIVVSWSLFFLACCVHYFLKRGALIPIAIWAALSVILIVAYPTFGREFPVLYTTRIYYAVTAVSWLVILYGVVTRVARIELAHVMLLIYAAVDVVVVAVPFANAGASNWPVARAASSLTAAGMLTAHVAVLLRDRSASRRLQEERV